VTGVEAQPNCLLRSRPKVDLFEAKATIFCPQSVVLDALRKILRSLYYLPTLSNCPVKLEVVTVTKSTEIPAAVSACVWCGKQHISDELTCENI